MGEANQVNGQAQDLEALRKQNANHPELEGHDGDMFLDNYELEDVGGIPYKTKWHGIVAYDESGKSIPSQFPVFVKKEEFEQAQVTA